MGAPLEKMRCPFCARWRMDRRGVGKWRKREQGSKRGKKQRGRERKGGNFSACVFHSKTFWQGRAHSVAGSGAILKSPTGSLREAGSQNRYISGLPGFFFSFLFFFPSPSIALSFPFFDSQLRIAEQVSSHFLLKQWDSAHKHSIAVHKQINTWADQTDRQTDTHTLAHTYKHSGGTQEVTMHWKWLPFTHNAFHTAAEVERGRESVCAGGVCVWEEGVGGTICDYLHWHKMSVRKQSAIFTLMHANNRQPLTQGRDLVCSAIFRSQEKEG